MDTTRPRLELDRLIKAHHTSYAALSRMLGRNAAYVQQYIKRGSPDRLEEDDRRLLADFFGVDEALLGGTPRGAAGRDGLLLVPKLDARPSAGTGSVAGDDVAVGHYAFDRRWLRDISNGKPENLSIVRVRGDSMMPTLADGDDILVDRIDRGARLRDGIYVLRHDDALLVKRLALRAQTGRLGISSDNPAYPGWGDCDPAAVDVVGRVVWTGRKLG